MIRCRSLNLFRQNFGVADHLKLHEKLRASQSFSFHAEMDPVAPSTISQSTPAHSVEHLVTIHDSHILSFRHRPPDLAISGSLPPSQRNQPSSTTTCYSLHHHASIRTVNGVQWEIERFRSFACILAKGGRRNFSPEHDNDDHLKDRLFHHPLDSLPPTTSYLMVMFSF